MIPGQAAGREGGHPVVSTADRSEVDGAPARSVRESTVRDDRRTWCYVYDVETGEIVSEHVFDLVEDPRSLDPRPVDTVTRGDPEFCRLVAACRDEVLQRFGLPAAASPCALER